jgi:hypothetical protein
MLIAMVLVSYIAATGVVMVGWAVFACEFEDC